MRRQINFFSKNDSGATSVEYVLLATLVAIAIIGIVTSISVQLGVKFTAVVAAFT